jgi:aryl-alcohol dehydrogenase-like predicted oxidoreductase
MDYKRLGASGVKVSQVCLGAMTFGREAEEKTSFEIMDFFAEQGGNFIDTANAYTAGASEQMVGKWMKARKCRDAVVLATKVYGTMGPGPNDGGLSRRHIMAAVDDSLARLQTDYIDLYQIHRWDPNSPPEETLSAMSSLIDAGKVRYIGCSNLTGWQLAQYLYLADLGGLARFVSIQPVYNALNRGIELEVLPLCKNQGIGVISYNPLAGGMLTGKYKRGGELPDGARLQAYEFYHRRYYTDLAFDVIEGFIAKAEEMGVTPAQLALAWAAGDPRITAPIIGARNIGQITDSLKGLDITLSAEERTAIPAIPSGKWVGVDPVYDRS